MHNRVVSAPACQHVRVWAAHNPVVACTADENVERHFVVRRNIHLSQIDERLLVLSPCQHAGKSRVLRRDDLQNIVVATEPDRRKHVVKFIGRFTHPDRPVGDLTEQLCHIRDLAIRCGDAGKRIVLLLDLRWEKRLEIKIGVRCELVHSVHQTKTVVDVPDDLLKIIQLHLLLGKGVAEPRKRVAGFASLLEDICAIHVTHEIDQPCTLLQKCSFLFEQFFVLGEPYRVRNDNDAGIALFGGVNAIVALATIDQVPSILSNQRVIP